MTNRGAAERTIKAMEAGGLLEDVDSALTELVLALASAVDLEPGNASLWREYRGAVSDLRSLSDGGNDAFQAAMAGLFASVRDPENAGKAESDG